MALPIPIVVENFGAYYMEQKKRASIAAKRQEIENTKEKEAVAGQFEMEQLSKVLHSQQSKSDFQIDWNYLLTFTVLCNLFINTKNVFKNHINKVMNFETHKYLLSKGFHSQCEIDKWNMVQLNLWGNRKGNNYTPKLDSFDRCLDHPNSSWNLQAEEGC